MPAVDVFALLSTGGASERFTDDFSSRGFTEWSFRATNATKWKIEAHYARAGANRTTVQFVETAWLDRMLDSTLKAMPYYDGRLTTRALPKDRPRGRTRGVLSAAAARAI